MKNECSCWFLCSHQGFIHWSHFSFFLSLFPFIIDNCNYEFVPKGYKNEDFYFLQLFTQKLTWMLSKQVRLGINLLTHIRENTDFPWQKPWQLPNAEANFQDWIIMRQCRRLWGPARGLSLNLKKLYGSFFAFFDGVRLCHSYRATTRRLFTFYHQVHRMSCYLFDQPRKNERMSWSWNHPVVLNPGPLGIKKRETTLEFFTVMSITLFHVSLVHQISGKLCLGLERSKKGCKRDKSLPIEGCIKLKPLMWL